MNNIDVVSYILQRSIINYLLAEIINDGWAFQIIHCGGSKTKIRNYSIVDQDKKNDYFKN